jgi:hypothetical protein
MRPSQIKAATKFYLSKRRPVFIWGPPGVGKSDIVESIAKEQDIGLIDFRMALRDPTDIKGFPMPDAKSKTMKFYRDGELPTSGEGILFLDELNSATPATQAAAMQLTLTGKIGDYVLPEGWSIVAAGNRESDRSVVNRMPAALSLRFHHMDLEVSLDDWAIWAQANNMPHEMIGFMRFRQNLLHSFDPTQRSSPNPRSWAFASQIMNSGLDRDTEFEMMKGTVGDGAAAEFIAYMGVYKDLPTIDQILLNPDSVPVPSSPATLYALSTALGDKVKRDTFDRAMQYITRMPVEFQVVAVRDAVRKEAGCATTKAFTKWGIDNASIAM